MTHSNSRETTEATVFDLVVALNELRDTLVNVALMLHDRQFELDSDRRSAAIELSHELLKKSRHE